MTRGRGRSRGTAKREGPICSSQKPTPPFPLPATSILPALAAAIKTPEDAAATLKALVALRSARAARGQTQPLHGKASGALARALTSAAASPADAAAVLAAAPRYGLALGPTWLARAAYGLGDAKAAVSVVRGLGAAGVGGPNAAAATLAVAAAAGRPDLAAAWAEAYEKAGVRLNGAARGALARAAEGGGAEVKEEAKAEAEAGARAEAEVGVGVGVGGEGEKGGEGGGGEDKV